MRRSRRHQFDNAFAAAAATGLPLIDGDGMERAFPELQMTTFGSTGCPRRR